MSTLARRVGLAIRRHGLIRSGDRVAVALSGGSDSVALVWLLRDLAARGGWTLAGLLHVHHGLRREEADADEAFCRALAARLDVPIDVTHADVPALAKAARHSIEVAARDARYEAFSEGAHRLRATRVATGHTMDDQAETVLLRLLRGATARGVGGVRYRNGSIVRPLLECRRAELRRDLARRGESFREDSSNGDVRITRNRLRHELMPVIARIAPTGVTALARFASAAEQDERHLTQEARRRGRLAVLGQLPAGGVQLARATIVALPPALSRRVVREVIESLRSTVSRRHVDEVLHLAGSQRTHGHLDLSGVCVDMDARIVRLAASGAAMRVPPVVFEHALPVPGSVEIPETSGVIEASYQKAGLRTALYPTGRVAAFQASALPLPLVVRSRRPGDRFRPLGSPGSRKLQDVLVDRKVPRDTRDRLPIVTDAEGRIVWVAGVVAADHCRVTLPEAGVVILEFKALEKGY